MSVSLIDIDPLVVNSWVALREGCDITYRVHDSEGVYITVCGRAHPFELFFETDALRDFLTRGSEAMAELDALADQEDAEEEAEEQARIDRKRPA